MGIGSLGFSEMVVIFVIILIFFGPRRFPEIARSLGHAMREFRRSLNQIQRELEEADPRSTIPGRGRGSSGPAKRTAGGGGKDTGERERRAETLGPPDGTPPEGAVTPAESGAGFDARTPGEQIPMFDTQPGPKADAARVGEADQAPSEPTRDASARGSEVD